MNQLDGHAMESVSSWSRLPLTHSFRLYVCVFQGGEEGHG
jgi:hypothetical protein